MSVLWIILWSISYTHSTFQQLPCDYGIDDVCSTDKPCSVSCDQQCSVFVDNGDVSFCGWLQSFGYQTIELLVNPQQYNIKIEAIANDRKADVTDGLEKKTLESTPHFYPFTRFQFLSHPLPSRVKLGSKIEFTCNAEANSSLSYQWYKKQEVLPNHVPGATSKVFTIEKAQSSHMGYYICEVTESASGDVYWSKPAQLEVLYLEKSSDDVSPKNLEVESGRSKVSVTCNIPESYPPALATWFKYDTPDVAHKIEDLDDTFYDSKTGTLYLINTNKASHESKYECRADNKDLEEYTVVETVIVTITGTFSAADFPPTKAFFDDDAAMSARVGESLVLRCAAYGNPLPEIYWAFGDDVDTLCRIPSSRYTSLDNGRTVILHAVKEQDTDYRYECKAESPKATKTIGSLTDVGKYKKLKITQDELDYIPSYRSNLTLSCPVTGEDWNYWYKNGVRITAQNGEYTRNKTENSLTIATSSSTHGVYTCLSLGPTGGEDLYGRLELKNLHITMPVLPLSVHLFLDLSSEAENLNQTFLTCVASGFPPPRVYWFENKQLVTDFTRYSVSFDKSNSTIINTTLNISNLQERTEIKCLAVSLTEYHVNQEEAFYTVSPEGEKSIATVQSQNVYIIIGGSCVVVILLVSAMLFILWRYRRERLSTKPVRSYMKNVQQIQRDGGVSVSTKKVLGEEIKYAVQLHEILKTMDIHDEGGIDSFRDIVQDWVNEDVEGADEDSDFARRFRESFISKRSMGPRYNSSIRCGNKFKLDLNDKKKSESSILDETPERDHPIPLGRRIGSPRRASNPIYAPLPDEMGTDSRSTAL